jgi:hypothetical protein
MTLVRSPNALLPTVPGNEGTRLARLGIEGSDPGIKLSAEGTLPPLACCHISHVRTRSAVSSPVIVSRIDVDHDFLKAVASFLGGSAGTR